MSLKKPSGTLLFMSLVGAAFFLTFAATQSKAKTSAKKPPPKLFMMFSAYHLAPYDVAYVENAFRDLAQTGVNAIVYSTAGGVTDFWQNKKRLKLTEYSYNKHLFKRARSHKANVWLQMRVYNNKITLSPDTPAKSLTAAQIIQPGPKQDAFLKQVGKDFSLYNRYYSNNCTVIVFEEAGIYHSPGGGGAFWSGRAKKVTKRTTEFDRMFAANLAGIFELVKTAINDINPKCQIGMHLGHSVFLNRPFLTRAIDHLKLIGAVPDFIFYDFYLKAQRSFENYRNKLVSRKSYISETLKLPAYHLAQLHTMNAFQHGKGRSPSKIEINEMLSLNKKLGFDGIGFYTKNARKTTNHNDNPFVPNKFPQKTVYESSKDRWDYALLKLMETRSINHQQRFDLVLHGRFTDDAYIVTIKNHQTGQWDFLGYVNPLFKRRFREKDIIVFRTLRKSRYISSKGSNACAKTIVRLRPARKFRNGFLQGVHIIDTEHSRSFRTSKNIKFEILNLTRPAESLANAAPRARLNKDATTVAFCQNNQ